MAKTLNRDFSMPVVQMQRNFKQYLTNESIVLGRFIANGEKLPQGTNVKYEWLEDQMRPQSWAVNGAVSSVAGTITFDSTAWLQVWTIVRFVTAAGAEIGNVQAKCTAITDGTDAVFSVYWGTTDAAIADDAVAKKMTDLVAEWEDSSTETNDWEATKQYNYFQIYRQTVKLSWTALATEMYDNASEMVSQLKQAYYRMSLQMAECMLRGRRVERDATEKGTHAGLDFYVNTSWGNVKSVSWPITSTAINDVLEMIKKDGWKADTIYCNISTARKISAFNTSWNNPVMQRTETTTGSYVMRFLSDIPVAGWLLQNIIIDDNVSGDKAYLLALDKIAMVPMKGRQLALQDATLPWADNKKYTLRWEYTALVRDGKYSMWVLTDLT